ncbi:hypothetical protein [Oryza sativa Japonica Group]|uniref:Uncharacterized protein OSJNBa0089K24.14 n=1 Tax=Oryza sativa subsp. japonica TaxID=39947 RepID=Q5VR13_ORYSJ|nr:hypothetical protein [Oryza sativa Japonica Group]
MRGPPVSGSGGAVHRGPGPRGWSTAGPRDRRPRSPSGLIGRAVATRLGSRPAKRPRRRRRRAHTRTRCRRRQPAAEATAQRRREGGCAKRRLGRRGRGIDGRGNLTEGGRRGGRRRRTATASHGRTTTTGGRDSGCPKEGEERD